MAIAIFGGIFLIYSFIKANIGSEQNNAFYIKDVNQLFSTGIIFLIILIMFMLVKSIIFSSKLIMYMRKATDEEIENNKWLLALLSLSIGGFIIPFLFTRIRNTTSVGNQNAKVVLSKIYSTTGLVGSIFSFIAIAGSFYLINNHSSVVLSQLSKEMMITSVSLTLVILLFSAISMMVFFNKNIETSIKEKTSLGQFATILSYIFLIAVTINLVLQIIISILKLFEILTEQRNRGMLGIFELILKGIMIISTLYLISIIVEIIRGLWASFKDENGFVTNNELNNRFSRSYEEHQSNFSRR